MSGSQTLSWESLTENEASQILIEPKSRVIETLRLAVLDVGIQELIRRTGSTPGLLEKWINGKEWVPLNVVKEACEINRNRQGSPSYSRILSECTADAQFKILARLEVGKPRAPVTGEVSPSEAGVSGERFQEPGAMATRSEAGRQIVKVTVVLFVVPLLGAAAGFLIAGPQGAVTGTISSFAIVTVLAFLFLTIFPRKSVGAS